VYSFCILKFFSLILKLVDIDLMQNLILLISVVQLNIETNSFLIVMYIIIL